MSDSLWFENSEGTPDGEIDDAWLTTFQDLGLDKAEHGDLNLEEWIPSFSVPTQLGEIVDWLSYRMRPIDVKEARSLRFGPSDRRLRSRVEIRDAVGIWIASVDRALLCEHLSRNELLPFDWPGFALEDAYLWRVLGCDLLKANEIMAKGIDLDSALKWRQHGVPVSKIHSWRARFTNPEAAAEWLAVGVSPSVASILSDSGHQPSDVDGILGRACTWRDLQFFLDFAGSVERAQIWARLGLTVSEIRRWDRSVHSNFEIFNYFRSGASPGVVDQLLKRGCAAWLIGSCSGDFLPELVKWLDSGFTADQAIQWSRGGVALSDAVKRRGQASIQ